MAELWLSTRLVGPLAVVLAGGEVDLGSSPELRDHLLAVLCHLGPWLVLDLTRVTFVDSSGLAVLVDFWRRARAAGGELFLVGPSGAVARKLEVTGLDRRLAVCPDVDSVLESLPASCSGPHRNAGQDPGGA
ncbi:STAS domain-containing protein [Actinomadura kijaniata]|uniref:STAS domain-containing protein n=1 Tax=Actinomadura kijaniata TaxID=46161 RepID=UPI003F1C306B